MFDPYKFYLDLVALHGLDYAANYFDIWFRVWCDCGDSSLRQYSEHYCRTFKKFLYG